jgi:hypothetical protein
MPYCLKFLKNLLDGLQEMAGQDTIYENPLKKMWIKFLGE